MESYWYTKKNLMKDLIEKGIDFNPALTLCLKTECELWENGECFNIRKVVMRR